jgi:hypothetical protein
MLAWAAYLLVVSGIMSVAALSLERAIRPYGFATRWIWVCALLGSLVFPLALSQTVGQTEIAPAWAQSLEVGTPRVSAGAARPEWAVPLPLRVLEPKPIRLEALVEAVWFLSSTVALAILLVGGWYGGRRCRRWRRVWITGTELLVSKDAGPATVGLLHPQIVLPEWLLAATSETLLLVIAHERSHVAARDTGLLGLGLGLAVLTAWNPLTWWQVHRLRLAIEVDCDRRVLSGGYDAHRYGKILVDVSTRRPAYFGALAASPRSLSSLERRIILMNTPRIRGWRASTAACTLLSVGVAMATILISPPAIPPASAGTAGAAEQTDIGRYVGSYEFSTVTVLRIELKKGQLAAAYPGARPVSLMRVSGQEFRFGKVEAYLRFATDAAGRVLGVVLQQNGVATEAPRIDAQRVLAIDSSVSERVHDQVPVPGSEVALRQLIVGIESGNPDYAEMSPQVAAGTRTMLANFQETMRPWGAIRAIRFRGVAPNGWDQYLVQFDRGAAAYRIAVDPYGVIVGVLTHPER